MLQRSVDPAAIEAEVDHIRSLGIDALRRRSRMMFEKTPPAGLTKDIMARMIAYRLKVEAFGGLDRETTNWNETPQDQDSRPARESSK
jgi:Protein of unknown function (DUF2924)